MDYAFADRLGRVEASAIRELFKLLGKPGLISFAGGFPDASCFDVEGIEVAAREALADDSGAALQYGATEGYEPLRHELATLMRRRGVAHARPEGLVVTTGSQQALDLIAKAFINAGDVVLVEGPTFLAAIQCFRLYGARVVPVPADAQGMRTEALARLVKELRPKLIYLVPTFANPTGTVMPLERRMEILSIATSSQVLLVEDDPYGELHFGEPPPPSLLALSSQFEGSLPWVAHCGSLSKVLSPGLRVGWVGASAKVLAKLVLCKQFADAHTSTFGQATAARYLASGRMAYALERVRKVYAARAGAMASELSSRLGKLLLFDAPTGGMFIWARLAESGAGSASDLARRAIASGVAFVPGAPFYAADPDPATLRLSFATASIDAIRGGVDRLAGVLRQSDWQS